MALGNTLREAREARGLSITEVAEHTNMMVQIVEELENEDFHRIAAPIYGRGFLKLYAELLGIDVQPLINEFMDIYTGKVVPAVQRKESVPAEIKKPIPIPVSENQLQEIHSPEKVEIVPQQALRSIDGTAKPFSAGEHKVSPVHQPVSIAGDESTPVLSSPVKDRECIESAAVEDDMFSERNAYAAEEPVGVESLSSNIPPEPGDDLFAADEPNLFNSSPLQERIAEAKRLMEEKESAKKEEQKKKTSLHLGTNQTIPVFQIGGRMDKTYEAKPKKYRRSMDAESFAGSILRGIGEFFREHRIRLPFNFSTEGNRALFVYGSLGIIVLVFIASGVFMIFKLTAPSVDKEVPEQTETVITENSEKVVAPLTNHSLDEIPPPPDMYFD